MSDTPKLLDALIRTPAPSGYETPAAEVWRDAARGIDGGDVRTDTLGSSVVEIAGAEGAPRLAIVGHIDEIGLHVTYIDDDGFLWFGPIGGWDPQILVGQRVTVIGYEGEIPGVLGKKPIHLLKDDDRKKPAKLEQMHIDIGAAESRGGREAGPHRRCRRARRGAARVPQRPPRLALARQPARLLRLARDCPARGGEGREHRERDRLRRRAGGDHPRSAPRRPASRSTPISRSPSTSPTPPTLPASTRRRTATTRSAPGP